MLLARINAMSSKSSRELQEETISDDAKNGLVTATGVIIAFILGFFVNYTSSDQPWRVIDVVPLGLISLSILVLTGALYRAFIPYRQTTTYFERSVHWLLAGVIMALFGAVSGVFL